MLHLVWCHTCQFNYYVSSPVTPLCPPLCLPAPTCYYPAPAPHIHRSMLRGDAPTFVPVSGIVEHWQQHALRRQHLRRKWWDQWRASTRVASQALEFRCQKDRIRTHALIFQWRTEALRRRALKLQVVECWQERCRRKTRLVRQFVHRLQLLRRQRLQRWKLASRALRRALSHSSPSTSPSIKTLRQKKNRGLRVQMLRSAFEAWRGQVLDQRLGEPGSVVRDRLIRWVRAFRHRCQVRTLLTRRAALRWRIKARQSRLRRILHHAQLDLVVLNGCFHLMHDCFQHIIQLPDTPKWLAAQAQGFLRRLSMAIADPEPQDTFRGWIGLCLAAAGQVQERSQGFRVKMEATLRSVPGARHLTSFLGVLPHVSRAVGRFAAAVQEATAVLPEHVDKMQLIHEMFKREFDVAGDTVRQWTKEQAPPPFLFRQPYRESHDVVMVWLDRSSGTPTNIITMLNHLSEAKRDILISRQRSQRSQ